MGATVRIDLEAADPVWRQIAERGVGAVVLDREAPRPPVAEQERFARRLKLLIAEARAAGVSVALLRRTIEDVL